MSKYDLIIVICNHGFSEEVMETAKSHGARGGTIMHGRGTAAHEVKKFFGITISPEKDIILIVVEEQYTNPIMQAINSEHGINKEPHAICLSLPVDDTIGFHFDSQE